MKKALALVLALVLALSMAVSAFALTLDLIPLAPVEDPETKLIKLNTIVLNDADETLVANKGGVYHVVIENAELYKDIAVSGNGIVSAKLVEFDPEVYASIGETYSVVRADGKAVDAALVAKYTAGAATGRTYGDAKLLCKYFNDDEKTTQYKVVCDQEIVVVELVIAENYSASYKEGTLKVTATEKATGKAMSGTWDVISDVIIFEYENVKWAGKSVENVLVVGEKGYSDFETAENGYGKDYNSSALRTEDGAAVISTTAFRAIEGKDVVVAADANNYVTIYDVVKGQKGVNFSLYGYDEIIESNEFVGYEFGFFGNQVVNSKFEITLQPGVTYYQLREAFGVKVEEDDIVDFYLLKDGKVAQIITVDFMTVDLAEKVEITVAGENTTLGQYELRLAAPVAAEGEENPNTGAESVVGVVAALAVVSVATAAAVSLKK